MVSSRSVASLAGPGLCSAPLPITAIVLTFNEERNLVACLDSLVGNVAQIIVVDSFSTDRTVEIARRYTDNVYQNPWVNHAVQYDWATRETTITQPWLMRVDADERCTAEGFAKLRLLVARDNIDGIYIRKKIYFMGRWIRHGYYPNYFMRVYRREKGHIENRWMDEHIEVEGNTFVSDIDIIEANYDREKNLALFTDKHNNYSTREAIDMLMLRGKKRSGSVASLTRTKTEAKRWVKENVYARTPLFVRPAAYFAYRYVVRGGFLDGPEGFVFHTLQALWYRFLVDAKIYQIEKLAAEEGRSVEEVIRDHFGVCV
jgi:glycosyltransferase involved in cell wall biosynthesis